MNKEHAAVAPEPEFDPIEAILDAHEGNPRAAIGDLVYRVQHLRYQLSLASAVMSKGMTRGWEPTMD